MNCRAVRRRMEGASRFLSNISRGGWWRDLPREKHFQWQVAPLPVPENEPHLQGSVMVLPVPENSIFKGVWRHHPPLKMRWSHLLLKMLLQDRLVATVVPLFFRNGSHFDPSRKKQDVATNHFYSSVVYLWWMYEFFSSSSGRVHLVGMMCPSIVFNIWFSVHMILYIYYVGQWCSMHACTTFWATHTSDWSIVISFNNARHAKRPVATRDPRAPCIHTLAPKSSLAYEYVHCRVRSGPSTSFVLC